MYLFFFLSFFRYILFRCGNWIDKFVKNYNHIFSFKCGPDDIVHSVHFVRCIWQNITKFQKFITSRYKMLWPCAFRLNIETIILISRNGIFYITVYRVIPHYVIWLHNGIRYELIWFVSTISTSVWDGVSMYAMLWNMVCLVCIWHRRGAVLYAISDMRYYPIATE